MKRSLPAGLGILSLLAAAARPCEAAGSPSTWASGEPATSSIASATLSLSLGESLAICDSSLVLIHRGPGPALVRVPLPSGRLASQESPSRARITFASGSAAPPAPVGLVQLPAPGHHRLQFQLHLPAKLEEGTRAVTLPPPGAPVCELRIRMEPGWVLDPRSAPEGFWSGDTWIAAFPPSSQPLNLRWRALRAACESGLGVQKSRFAYCLRDGELHGKLEFRGTFDGPAAPDSVRCRIPDDCIVTAAVSPALTSWVLRGQELLCSLRPGVSREFELILHTVSPVHAADARLLLALPRLSAARRAEGTLELTNEGPHAIGGFELPAGFIAQAHGAPDKHPGKGTGPDLAYRFFSLEDNAAASLTLFQPRPRIRSTLTTGLSLDEQQAEIIREIQLQAEIAPIFSAAIQLPADEFADSVRLVEGDADIRRSLSGAINLTWNAGLLPGRKARLAIVSRKSLAWNQGTALFRLEPPRLPGEWTTGKLTLCGVPSLSLRPVRNSRLNPVPASELPEAACAAWNHGEFDALLIEIGMRQAQRSAALVSRVWPDLHGGRITGELRIDPGGLPLGEIKVLLNAGDPRTLRFSSERVAATHPDADAGTVTACFDPPLVAPFSLPWEMPLPVEALPSEGAARCARLAVPLLRTPGIPLPSHRVTVYGGPFCSVELTAEGLDSVSPSGGHLPDGVVSELLASSPEPTLRMTCRERGAPVEPLWEIEELTLASQVAAFAPHRHRCHLVVLPSPAPRTLPLVLPPQSTLLSASVQGRRMVPLESPAHAGEVLFPLPASTERLCLSLDYLTAGVPWAVAGETNLTPPTLPERALVRKCGWTLRLPLDFEYSDFVTSLSSLDPPAILPITLQPLRSFIATGDLLRRQLSLATPVSTRRFHGNFTPSPISFRYIRQSLQLWTALLWVLGGLAAFAVFAKERPLYHGLFGLLLLTFLPSSGLASPRIFSDGLLLGWLTGGAILALSRLMRKHRSRLPKPAAGLATALLAILGGCPQHSRSADLDFPLFDQSTHEIQIASGDLRVVSTYLTTAPLPDRNSLPVILGIRQFDSLTVDGSPFDFDQENSGAPDSRPQTVAATYRVPLSPHTSWKIAPAASSLAIISGIPSDRSLRVNGGLPLTRLSPESVAAALGADAQVRLDFAKLPPSAPVPVKARVRAALGLFPATQRLLFDLTFEHPGHALDRFFLDVPREFRLLSLTGSHACHATETAMAADSLQLVLGFESPRRDRSSFRLEWEAPLPPGQLALPCLLPRPRAAVCEASLTLAAVPPLAAALRSLSQLPADKPFLPSHWANAAKVAECVRLPAPGTSLWADLRLPQEPGSLHLNQLFVIDQGRADAYCQARFDGPAAWLRTEFVLHPALTVTAVSGASVADWNQTGNRLALQRRFPPDQESGESFLVSLGWDPSSSPGEIPFPAMTNSEFPNPESSATVATGSGFKVLNAPPLEPDASHRLPVPLTGPLRLRASLAPAAAPGHRTPRMVPAAPVYDAVSVLAVAVAPDGLATLDFHIEASPQDSSLESLSVLLPGRFPAIRWNGAFLREAKSESTSGSDLYSLVFTGPVHLPVSCTGSAQLSLAGTGLQLPFPAVPGATNQHRYLVLRPTASAPWVFLPDGVKEIPADELPGRRSWPAGTRAFAVATGSPSLAISREPPALPPALDVPSVLDLHLATTLRKNGESSHRAQAWITPLSTGTLDLELPASSVLIQLRLNGEPATFRSLSAPGKPPVAFAIALPTGPTADAPLLLEIEYDTFPETPAPKDTRRLEFQLEAPRLDNLPVVQTAWQIDALPSRSIRQDEGNLYPLDPGDFAADRAQTLVSLARDLKRSLERESRSPEQQTAIRSRMLTLTGHPAVSGQGHSARPEWEEARTLRDFASRGLKGALPAAAAPRTAFIPLPVKSSACFKKLRGDARLHLAALPESDPGILKSWFWFGAALTALAAGNRLFGNKATQRATTGPAS